MHMGCPEHSSTGCNCMAAVAAQALGEPEESSPGERRPCVCARSVLKHGWQPRFGKPPGNGNRHRFQSKPEVREKTWRMPVSPMFCSKAAGRGRAARRRKGVAPVGGRREEGAKAAGL